MLNFYDKQTQKYHKDIEMKVEKCSSIVMSADIFVIDYKKIGLSLISSAIMPDDYRDSFYEIPDIIEMVHTLHKISYEFNGWYCGAYCNEIWDEQYEY